MRPDVTPPEIKIYGSRLRVPMSRSRAQVVLRSSFRFSLRIFEQKLRETACSLRISFERQNMTEFTANMLISCILYCDAGPGYHFSSHVYLRRRRSFTSRKLYGLSRDILMFFVAI